MDQTRQDRLQQRLRGAQRREIKDVDFGSFLPPPSLAPPPPPVRAVEGEQSAQTQPTTQAQPEASSQPLRRSPRRSPSQGRARQPSLNAASGSTSAFDANTSAKRRKLDVEDARPSSSRSGRALSQPPPRPDIYDIPPDPVEEIETSIQPTESSILEEVPAIIETEVDVTENNDTTQNDSALLLPVPSAVIVEPEETQEVPENESINGDGVESVVRVSRNKRKRPEEPPTEPATEPPRRRSARVSDISNATISSPTPSIATPTPSTQAQPKKRGRKPRISKEQVPIVEEQVPEEVPEEVKEPEVAEAINDEEAAIQLKKNRRSRRISGGAPESESTQEISSQQVLIPSKPRGKQRPAATASPEQQRQPKTKTLKKARNSEVQKRQRRGSPIPVTVHRLTERPQYADSESDAEILNSEIPFAHQGGVNPIDVLSQFCEEVVTAALESFATGIDNATEAATKREYKVKYRAIEEFGQQVQNRLLEHTINLDNNHALHKRLREQTRIKLSLRKEILSIRAEREKVALKMDDIRIKHEAERLNFEKRNTLNTSMHDIEVALERAQTTAPQENEKEVEMDGIEVLMKRITGKVSSNSDEGGILRRIKDFNAFLERAAVALEGRGGDS